MGVDAMIFFKVRAGVEAPEFYFPEGFEVKSFSDSYGPPGATHEVDTLSRYYGKHYERGNWPSICAVLMALHACLDVERVWYDGDSSDNYEVCTPETVLDISRHYMDFGDRPYRRHYSDKTPILAKVHTPATAGQGMEGGE